MSRNGPNKTVFAARNRTYAMVNESIWSSDQSAQEIANEWRKNPEYSMVRVTSFKAGKRPDRCKGERQQYRFAVRAYAK